MQITNVTPNTKQSVDADVAIIGGGPVGTLLALLLGKQGKYVTLVERWPTIYDRPRAVTMDHEVARVLASLGIDCDNDPAFEYHEELYYWKNAKLENLELVDWESVASSGWRVTYWFNQPELEARLLGLAAAVPTINIVRGWEAISLHQNANFVTLGIQETAELNPDESQQQFIKAKYVVGCDGANSFVRDALDIANVDKGYFFDWLILDVIPHEGYQCTPNQWQLCDPKRPTTIVPGGPGRRRWEFMVLPEESPEDIVRPDKAWELLEPWGLTPDNAQLERSAVYRFQARWAEEWRVGRCIIAGDAAHLMPPFAGAGMCSGIRDAVSLGWRLNGILEQRFDADIIDSYVSERLHHVKFFIDFSQQLGDIICITDPEEAAARDQSMQTALAERNHEPIKVDLVQLGAGIWCEDTQGAGFLSTQGLVAANGQQNRFDQVVGSGWMVIGYQADPAQYLCEQQNQVLQKIGGRTVIIGAPNTACDVEDVTETYKHWLQTIDATFLILRPDFYVAATAKTASELRDCFAVIQQALYLR